MVGAEVYATAHPDKWEALRAMGVDHLASSRTLEFAQQFASSAPAGLDLVLNSLIGEFIDASLKLLAPGGRFIELGKRDIRLAESMKGAAGDGVAVVYRPFDLAEAGQPRLQEILSQVAGLVQEGK